MNIEKKMTENVLRKQTPERINSSEESLSCIPYSQISFIQNNETIFICLKHSI